MELKNKLKTLREICIKDNIPLVRKNTEEFIINFINSNNIQSILEIGTAYGYSCLSFYLNCKLEYIESLEKNPNNYQFAKKYIDELNLQNIKIINTDAFEYHPSQNFDLIFIDGPKGRQIELFEKYVQFLKPGGKIIIDNLYLNKIRNIDKEARTKSQDKLLEKLDSFVEYLKHLSNYKFELIDIDDGVGVVYKYE